jgi:hypothetical protein
LTKNSELAVGEIMKVEELAASLRKKNYNVRIIKDGEYRAVEIIGRKNEGSDSNDSEGNGQGGTGLDSE